MVLEIFGYIVPTIDWVTKNIASFEWGQEPREGFVAGLGCLAAWVIWPGMSHTV